jgi:hypothetical protein
LTKDDVWRVLEDNLGDNEGKMPELTKRLETWKQLLFMQ